MFGIHPSEVRDWEWHISVVCQNEAARIEDCLISIGDAIGSRRALVTLNVNGSTDDSEVVAQHTALACGIALQVYRTEAADKSNVLNRFIHTQRVPARMYAFVDGYVRISPNALHDLDACLAAHPYAMAATGVCRKGRSMAAATSATLEQGGRLHGQLHALRPEFLDRMVEQGVRLPIGLYWGDGLMGSMAMHNLDAVGEAWDTKRIVGVAGATYEIPALSMFKPRDLRRQFRRKLRQMRGRLQNEAIKAVIYRHGYTALPLDADDLVRDYLLTHSPPAVPLLDRPFMRLMLHQLQSAGKPTFASLVPQCATVPIPANPGRNLGQLASEHIPSHS